MTAASPAARDSLVEDRRVGGDEPVSQAVASFVVATSGQDPPQHVNEFRQTEGLQLIGERLPVVVAHSSTPEVSHGTVLRPAYDLLGRPPAVGRQDPAVHTVVRIP